MGWTILGYALLVWYFLFIMPPTIPMILMEFDYVSRNTGFIIWGSNVVVGGLFVWTVKVVGAIHYCRQKGS